MTAARPVEILGGGLAGLSLGLALRHAGIPVTLHEAGDYPRHRVCGEFIAGLDSATRATLRLDEHLADALAHHELLWFHRDRPVRRQTLPTPALALDRHHLDERLARAFAAAGGALHTHSRLDPVSAPEGRVFATGRRPARGGHVGLKLHADNLPLHAPLEVHLGRDAYVGLCDLGDRRVNIAGIFPAHPATPAAHRHDALLHGLHIAGLDALADRLAAATPVPGSHTAVAGLGFSPPPRLATDRIQIGDTHAMVPPFTGNGMAMAFQSAAAALDPLVAWSRGERPWPDTIAEVHRRLHARFHRRLRFARWLHPFLLRPARQPWLATAARGHLLPLTPLYHALH